MTSISIVGTGYVGLVTGVCLASLGHDVVCIDADPAKVALIESGETPIHEVGLDDLLSQTLGSGFSVTGDLEHAVRSTEMTIIAVGTPSTPEGIDLTAIRRASAQVGRVIADLDRFHAVVVKSTVVPGTTDTVVREELERASGKSSGIDFGLGTNPEFLTEGTAVDDFMRPDRIVIGADDDRTMKMLAGLYSVFTDVPVIETNSRTAEMIKYASNALLATMISFSNELANLGAALGGIDTVEVMAGVHASRYLTVPPSESARTAPIASFLYAGCGFGGSCLPKDVRALASHGQSIGLGMPVLESVLAVNERQPSVVVDLIDAELGGLGGKTIGVLGLAFKPDTDDTRLSPAFPIIDLLHSAGATVLAHDPIVTAAHLPRGAAATFSQVESVDELIRSVDAVVIVTSWDEYKSLPTQLEALETQPVVVDGRRMLEPRSVARYVGIGR